MTFAKIQDAINGAVAANRGRAYINATSAARADVRLALEGVAVACGVPALAAERLPNDALAGLYALARKDMSRAQSMARTMADNAVPPLPSGPNPFFDPAPPPAPPAAPAPPATGLDPQDFRDVLYTARKAARDEATRVLDTAMADTHDEVRKEAIAFVTREVAGIQSGIEAAATKAVAALAPTQLTIVKPDMPSVELGTVHYAQEELIDLLALDLNVYLYGPAGSGKTTGGKLAAKAFGLPFYFTGKIDSEYLLLGFKDARGDTVRTPFREAYEHGGVFLFDEVDRSSPSAFVALNAALANGICAFPDGTIERHANFKCIAAGNTRMTGADNTYTSGQQQDASSIDRFAFLTWGYDEKLELALASDKAWCRLVQAVRKQCDARGINHLVTPRATLDGCKLIYSGKTWERAAELVLWKGLDDITVQQLRDATRDMWGLI